MRGGGATIAVRRLNDLGSTTYGSDTSFESGRGLLRCSMGLERCHRSTPLHTLSGDAAEEVGEVIEVEIAPKWDAQRREKRRREVGRNRREVHQRIAMGPVRAGVEADDRGRWAVRGIMAVRRHEGRRGRPLDVLVEWEGEDSDGDLWEESWVSVTELTPDLRAEARRLEMELFGPRHQRGAETSQRTDALASRRADRRAAAVQRQERERDVQQWRARLRDRAPTLAGVYLPSSGAD